MSIARNDDEIWLECDECGSESTPHLHFDKAVWEVRLDGWVITHRHGAYTHLCPDCDGVPDRLARAKAMFKKD